MAATEETMNGVHVVRGGRQSTVHLHALSRYRGKLRDRFDVVIDEVNTIPFFSPMWADIPSIMLIFQLAREVWWYESVLPLNAIGYVAEPLYLRAYRRTPVLTISQSTADDLCGLGFSGPITVVPIGVEPVNGEDRDKASVPTFVYVGRLAPSKRIADIVLGFHSFRQRVGTGRLWLIGDGPPKYVQSLHKLVDRLDIRDSIDFLGHLPLMEKQARLKEAHALLMTSVREGWGLVVTEANACGTPAVVYDVPGLRDSVRDGETGILVRPWPIALAEGMLRLYEMGDAYERMAAKARVWSSTFSYEATADAVRNAIVGLAGRESLKVTTWCL
jgi:glycosyltransferase involved in cell wall biosynthesis